MSETIGNQEFLSCEEMIERYSKYLTKKDIAEFSKLCAEDSTNSPFTDLKRLQDAHNKAFRDSIIAGKYKIPNKVSTRLLPEGAKVIEETDEYIVCDYPIWGIIKVYKFPEFDNVKLDNVKPKDERDGE